MQRILKMLIVSGIILMLVGVVKGLQNTSEGPKMAFENHGVYYIGQKNSFAGIALATAYRGQPIIPRTPEEMDEDSIVIFDSEMLKSPQAKEYIEEALRKGCWIVSIGRNNSKFMELIFQKYSKVVCTRTFRQREEKNVLRAVQCSSSRL